MKLFTFFSSLILISLLFISNQAFAVDFVDSSGYTPSWAKGYGYYTVLQKCDAFTGDYSRDANWCMEWMAYVLDQGIENFPESTSGNTKSFEASDFPLEDGPLYNGPLEKFLPEDLTFGNDWLVGTPFTTDLNLEEGLDLVIQRFVIPDSLDNSKYLGVTLIITKFESSSEIISQFEEMKNEIKNLGLPTVGDYIELEEKGTQGDSYVFEISKEYFGADCVGVRKNVDKNNESEQLACLKNEYIITIIAFLNKDWIQNDYISIGTPESAVRNYAKIIINKIDESSITEQQFTVTNVESASLDKVIIPKDTAMPGCEVTNKCFIPSSITIQQGDKITWSNDDTGAHTVTSGSPENGPDGNFDSSLFMAGNTFSVKFDDYEPGTYPYFCMVHPWMTGFVIVQEVSASSSSTQTFDSNEAEKIILDKNEVVKQVKASLEKINSTLTQGTTHEYENQEIEYGYFIKATEGNLGGNFWVTTIGGKVSGIAAQMLYESGNQLGGVSALTSLYAIVAPIAPLHEWKQYPGAGFIEWVGEVFKNDEQKHEIQIGSKKIGFNDDDSAEDLGIGTLILKIDYDPNVISKKLNTAVEQASPTEIQTKPNQGTQITSSNDSDDQNLVYYGVIGLFVFFGIPGIIIWLIIRKIKKRRRMKFEKNDSTIKPDVTYKLD
ncbi:MAG: cupredoxin domain-containing protein [Nitrosopumilaceae archaeon]